jgi:hypothetical protein
MAKKNTIPIRSDERFVREIKSMQRQRIRKGIDDELKPTAPSRITLAMTRHRLFPQMKLDIIKADLKK